MTRTRPTLFGVKALAFYALLLLAFFAAPYTNLFFLLACFAGVSGALSLYWSRRNLRGIEISLPEEAHAPAGSANSLVAKLQARREPFGLELVLGRGKQRITAPLHEKEGAPQQVEALLPGFPRGIHRFETPRLRSSYPFGIFWAERVLDTALELVVWPSPASLANKRSRGEVLSELGGLPTACTGTLAPSGLREYREGDRPGDIDWRATARRSELVVKEREGEMAPGIELSLDARCEEERFEETLCIVAALAELARENKEHFTLSTQGYVATHGPEQKSWSSLRRVLAGLRALPESAPSPPSVPSATIRLPAMQGTPA